MTEDKHGVIDDEAIRELLARLSRQHQSGGRVIERAAILAAGADSRSIVEWILAKDGQPEAPASGVARGGLHGGRLVGSGGDTATPRRYVLPPGVLTPTKGESTPTGRDIS